MDSASAGARSRESRDATHARANLADHARMEVAYDAASQFSRATAGAAASWVAPRDRGAQSVLPDQRVLHAARVFVADELAVVGSDRGQAIARPHRDVERLR